MSCIDWKPARPFTDIRYDKAEGIARIVINRPQVRNAFRPQTVREMREALADARDDEKIGVIRMDTNYSPVRKVSFRVEDTRVGQRTDYEKLVLGITTDGSVRPEDAIAFASKILKDHFQLFINFDEGPIDARGDDIDEEQERLVELLSRNVEELELSVRSANCLKAGKILTLFDLVTKSEQEMLKFRNFGRKSLNEITEILEGMDLAFGMSFEPEICEKVRPGNREA